MVSTVVHAGFALLLTVALLRGTVLDRRLGAVLVVLVVAPELDTVAGVVMSGAHRALFHTVVIPAVAVPLVYWDTRRRETSWIRHRWNDRGVRIVWVGLFVHVFAHLLLDYAHLEGINVLFPVYDQFFRLDGELFVSTVDGVTQTFFEIGIGPQTGADQVNVGAVGTTEEVHVDNPVEPNGDDEPQTEPADEPVDRRLPIAVHGWQLYMIVSGLFVAVARRLQTRRE
jgi:hypothetical protein